MAGYTPIAVIFTTLYKGEKTAIDQIFQYLVSKHQLSLESQSSFGRLVFDDQTGEWIDTVMITDTQRAVGQLVEEKTWVRIDGDLRVGKWSYPIEVYFFPVSKDDPRPCLEVKLPSRAYEAVFDFAPRTEGRFNESAKRGLIELCFGLAATTRVDGFMLRFDDGELTSLGVEDILARLRSPVMTLRGFRPGLITGIQNTFISIEEMESIWGRGVQIYENVAGYVILDLLQPLE